MKELMKSAMSFIWSTLLFGIERAGSAVAMRTDENRTTGSCAAVAQAAETELKGGFNSVYRIGNSFQETTVNFAFDLLTLETLSFRGIFKTGLSMMRQSANVLKTLLPEQAGGLILEEFQNKLTAFEWFEHVDSKLSLPVKSDAPLVLLLRRTENLDSFSRIWATEGIGFLFAERSLSEKSEPENLLSGALVKGAPTGNLVALHAGMGLSFAHRFLERLNCESSFGMMIEMLEAHIALYRKNAQSGYAELGIETLGLAARNLYPHLLLRIDEALHRLNESYAAYFWHGAGRAMYFAPTGLFPVWDESWSSIFATQDEPPHESGRLNALTGWLFALTLVNVRQPEIVADCFKRHWRLFAAHETVADGIGSAMIVWQISAQDNSYIESFLNYLPAGVDSELASQWRELVIQPVAAALRDYRTKPESERQPGRLFRCRRREI